MSKIAIGLNLRLGTWVKRMWFEVPDSKESKSLFFSLSEKINEIDSGVEWKDFLQTVERMFGTNGFFRIAK